MPYSVCHLFIVYSCIWIFQTFNVQPFYCYLPSFIQSLVIGISKRTPKLNDEKREKLFMNSTRLLLFGLLFWWIRSLNGFSGVELILIKHTYIYLTGPSFDAIATITSRINYSTFRQIAYFHFNVNNVNYERAVDIWNASFHGTTVFKIWSMYFVVFVSPFG